MDKQRFSMTYRSRPFFAVKGGALQRGHWVDFDLTTVLPGPAGAPPPNRPKITAIWCKHTANSNFTQIPLLFRYFLTFIQYKK
jgi:hypothetical protein